MNTALAEVVKLKKELKDVKAASEATVRLRPRDLVICDLWLVICGW